MLSVDSGENSRIKLSQGERVYDVKIVGLMEKAGSSGFTRWKVREESALFGKTIHAMILFGSIFQIYTTILHYRMLLDDMILNDPAVGLKLE